MFDSAVENFQTKHRLFSVRSRLRSQILWLNCNNSYWIAEILYPVDEWKHCIGVCTSLREAQQSKKKAIYDWMPHIYTTIEVIMKAVQEFVDDTRLRFRSIAANIKEQSIIFFRESKLKKFASWIWWDVPILGNETSILLFWNRIVCWVWFHFFSEWFALNISRSLGLFVCKTLVALFFFQLFFTQNSNLNTH